MTAFSWLKNDIIGKSIPFYASLKTCLNDKKAFLTFMVALFGFLCVVPHSLMAVGLAIAVIRSITRIPILPLVAGSAFITTLLYLDSQLLMLMCVYAIFKSVVMGKPLVNRQFWRRCCQME